MSIAYSLSHIINPLEISWRNFSSSPTPSANTLDITWWLQKKFIIYRIPTTTRTLITAFSVLGPLWRFLFLEDPIGCHHHSYLYLFWEGISETKYINIYLGQTKTDLQIVIQLHRQGGHDPLLFLLPLHWRSITSEFDREDRLIYLDGPPL